MISEDIINTFNEMIKIDQSELQGSLDDSIKEIAQEIQSSGGFNIDDYLNYDDTPSYKLSSNNSGRSEEKNIPLLPFLLEKVALDKSLMQLDGIHPNQKAQKIIAEQVKKELLNIFK